MNFREIDNFNPRRGERYIFVEQGKAKAVLLSFDDYQKMAHNKKELPEPIKDFGNPGDMTNAEEEFPESAIEIPEIEKEQDNFNENPDENTEQVKEEKEALKQELRNELTLDDLPF